MARYYYLGPWVWQSGDEAAWVAPEHTVGLVDLRPLASVETFGFFATDTPLAGEDYLYLGDSLHGGVGGINGLWNGALGTSAAGDNVLDLLWNTLTLQGDPDGAALCPPLMPTHRGMMELHLGGHSLVRARSFQGKSDPAWARVQALMQRNYRRLDNEAKGRADKIENARGKDPLAKLSASEREQLADEERDTPLKWLTTMRSKLRCNDADLIPADMPKARGKRPETIWSDAFTRANQSGLGTSSEGWSWTNINTTSGFSISSNAAVALSASPDTMEAAIAALSTDDMQVQLVYSSGSATARIGPSCRNDGTTNTAYLGWHRTTSGGNHRIRKLISGTPTDLINATSAISLPATIILSANGSTLSITSGGTLRGTVTDTAITGNLYGGLGGALSAVGDTWVAQDYFELGGVQLTATDTSALTTTPHRYELAGLTDGGHYAFYVSALNGGKESALSLPATGTADGTAPVANKTLTVNLVN